jgi:hypothetical protein
MEEKWQPQPHQIIAPDPVHSFPVHSLTPFILDPVHSSPDPVSFFVLGVLPRRIDVAPCERWHLGADAASIGDGVHGSRVAR